MSNSVRPHRRQPTKLPRPWDSPDKNTEVGCHFLLQCITEKWKGSRSVVSDPQWPTRLLHPWDFPGKSTGVGCHFLPQCIIVKSESEVAQSCPTLSDPTDCSPPGPPSMGFSRQEYWSGVPLPSPILSYDSLNINHMLILHMQARSFPLNSMFIYSTVYLIFPLEWQ